HKNPRIKADSDLISASLTAIASARSGYFLPTGIYYRSSQERPKAPFLGEISQLCFTGSTKLWNHTGLYLRSK
ncbi:hypothetical protein, partial [uncultured Dialister sp.]|uniref:hypothetical protein n=1 Tax=uncultured Dialister sp. TaxID=278064 RepID=UPI0025FC6C03